MLDTQNQTLVTTIYVYVNVSAPIKIYKIILSYMFVGFNHIKIWKKVIKII
jgi:hypothetical protein